MENARLGQRSTPQLKFEMRGLFARQPTFALTLLAIGVGGLALTELSGQNRVIWGVSGALWFVGLFLYSLLDSARSRGWKKTAAFFALVACISIGAEYCGVTTGWLFGHYSYNAPRVGPLLFGAVPLFIGGAWWLVIYMASAITDALRGSGAINAGFALIGAVALDALVATNLDLIIDPACVYYYNLWVWHDVGSASVQGIPISNYASWFVVVALIMFSARRWLWQRHTRASNSSAPRWLTLVPAGLYLVFQFKLAAATLLVGQTEAAFISALATLPIVLITVVRWSPA